MLQMTLGLWKRHYLSKVFGDEGNPRSVENKEP